MVGDAFFVVITFIIYLHPHVSTVLHAVLHVELEICLFQAQMSFFHIFAHCDGLQFSDCIKSCLSALMVQVAFHLNSEWINLFFFYTHHHLGIKLNNYTEQV